MTKWCFFWIYFNQHSFIIFSIRKQNVGRRYRKRSAYYHHDITSYRTHYGFVPNLLFYTFTKPYNIRAQVTSTYLATRWKIREFISYLASEITFSTLSCKDVSMKLYYIPASGNPV